MKIDGRGNSDGKGHQDGTQTQAEGTDDTGQDSPFSHCFLGWLRKECPVNGPPPFCHKKVDDDKQCDPINGSGEPEKPKNSDLGQLATS